MALSPRGNVHAVPIIKADFNKVARLSRADVCVGNSSAHFTSTLTFPCAGAHARLQRQCPLEHVLTQQRPLNIAPLVGIALPVGWNLYTSVRQALPQLPCLKVNGIFAMMLARLWSTGLFTWSA